MAIDPGAKQVAEPWTTFADSGDIPEWISKAYIDSYRGPHAEEPDSENGRVDRAAPATLVTPAMLAAHYRLGQCRPAGDSCVCVYPADDPAGFGPALQVVTDHGSMLMDSVTVLLHRLGVGYDAIMTPVFEVRRSPAGELLSVEPRAADASPYVGEAWIYVHLLPTVDPKVLEEVERLLPKVLADVQRVATDAAALIATMSELAARSTTTQKATTQRRTAKTSRRCCAGWATAISCCWATSPAECRTVWSSATAPAASVCCAPARVPAPG